MFVSNPMFVFSIRVNITQSFFSLLNISLTRDSEFPKTFTEDILLCLLISLQLQPHNKKKKFKTYISILAIVNSELLQLAECFTVFKLKNFFAQK